MKEPPPGPPQELFIEIIEQIVYNWFMNIYKPNLLCIGSGVPVVLLHSSMSSKIQWFRLMHGMRQDYLMIAVDFWGYGDTPMPADTASFTLKDEIKLVESLIADVIPAGQSFHLIGHSFGGAVALRYGYEFPRRIRSISIYEPVAFHLLPEDDPARQNVLTVMEQLNRLMEDHREAEAAEFFIDHWNGEGAFACFPEEAREYFLRVIKKLPLDSRALIEEPLRLEDYRQIDIPVCLMAGLQSPLESRRVSELLAGVLPDCHFHWVDSGHMAPVSYPHLVNPLVEKFIGSR